MQIYNPPNQEFKLFIEFTISKNIECNVTNRRMQNSLRGKSRFYCEHKNLQKYDKQEGIHPPRLLQKKILSVSQRRLIYSFIVDRASVTMKLHGSSATHYNCDYVRETRVRPRSPTQRAYLAQANLFMHETG